MPEFIDMLHQLRQRLSDRAAVEIDHLIFLLEKLVSQMQQTCDRYRVLAINQHLVGFKQGTIQALHPKLNDLIYPVLNAAKVEPEEFYQKIFAKIIVNSLLPALK